jgi:predicted nuclease with TOPRIM domain
MWCEAREAAIGFFSDMDDAKFVAAARSDVPALCDLADEQERESSSLREAARAHQRELNMMLEALHDASIKRDEQAARITSLEASVALLDEQGRKMQQERERMRPVYDAALERHRRTFARDATSIEKASASMALNKACNRILGDST